VALLLISGLSHVPLIQAYNDANGLSSPGMEATFIWKKQLFSPNSISKGPELIQVDSSSSTTTRLFIMSNDCEIVVLNIQGDILHRIEKSFNKCPSGLAFSQDYSFFLQTGHLGGET
jgi:hypothetical protein